jgi:hypothetical protein
MGRRTKIDVDIKQRSTVDQDNRADVDNDIDGSDFGGVGVTIQQDNDADVDQDANVSINIS